MGKTARTGRPPADTKPVKIPDSGTLRDRIAAIIRKRLEQLDQTQYWLAARLDVPRCTVNRLYHGTQMRVDHETLLKLSLVLDVTVDEMLKGHTRGRKRGK